MRSPVQLSHVLALCVAVFLLGSLPARVCGFAGIRIPYQREADPAIHGPAPPTDGNGGHVFPLLRWFRDSAVEIVFGPPGGRGSRGAKDDPVKHHGGAIQSRYRNDVVIRFNVTNSEEEGALSEAADRLFLDVWTFTDKYVDIRLHKDDVVSLMTLLPDSLQPTVLIPDVAAAVWATYPYGTPEKKIFGPDWPDLSAPKTSTDGLDNVFFRNYQPLSVITNWLRLLETMFPSFITLINIGKSYEGRDITALRMGPRADGNSDTGAITRKTILVTGGIHAREWISTSTVNYLIWSFATAYGEEPLITKLLQTFDVVFVPVVNPDGYEYTWQSDRLWRKSRQQTGMRFCRGLDLDHAFGYKWETTRHQRDPCSESYGGDEAFQAAEAEALANWAGNETLRGVQFAGFLDLHSYSQQVLFPYSYSCGIDPPNRENLEELATGLAKAIRLASGESYEVRQACEGAVTGTYSDSGSAPRIESGAGSAIDWFYHEIKARFSYQIKLRDTGSYGFLLPPDNIIPTGEEILHAIKYFGDYVLGNNGIEGLFTDQSDASADAGEWKDLKRRRRV